jgi:LysR family transcriptional regulator for bpeEF and oprC
MDRLLAMKVFTKIVEMNSFSRAADAMDLPHASATMIIKNLEDHLRVRLMQRTTRRLSLTPEGAEYYERCNRILAEIDEVEGTLSKLGRGEKGKLRVDMPAAIGRLLILPQLRAFCDAYPDIELTVSFGDKPIDLLQESVDCAIRVGALQDSTLVARRLGSLPVVTAASPDYIASHGMPANLGDLEFHTAVQYFLLSSGRNRPMNFVLDGEPTDVKVPGAIAVSDWDAYVMCGVNSMGLIQAPRFILEKHLRSGALVEVLAQCYATPIQTSIVYPHSKHLAAKVRVFIDWTAGLFENYAYFRTQRVATTVGATKILQDSEDMVVHGEELALMR